MFVFRFSDTLQTAGLSSINASFPFSDRVSDVKQFLFSYRFCLTCREFPTFSVFSIVNTGSIFCSIVKAQSQNQTSSTYERINRGCTKNMDWGQAEVARIVLIETKMAEKDLIIKGSERVDWEVIPISGWFKKRGQKKIKLYVKDTRMMWGNKLFFMQNRCGLMIKLTFIYIL